ncbi:kinesin-related protein 8 [Diorhabda carinulata]|uniref:kinesin-related protein 8 n=1 Tax=Diorhabda sublineata TaxID=1163346 RepID=UPI0024E0541A|nr:kinesin-related protein 8 [Diorhabda sublineata]XP_057656360.1 kinesin-related protein 8 [Diorhabda carinulata]
MPVKVDCRVGDADKHEFDVNCLLFHQGKLYSGSDDGKIKAWSADLKKIAEVQSNPCSVLCLAANENSLYSSSNEGTVKSFELDTLKEKAILAQDSQAEYWKVRFADGCLYSGDQEGNVKVWKGETAYGNLNISEPVRDMVVDKNLLFTANLDVIVTELKMGSEHLQFGLKKSLTGSPPITLIGNKYFAFLTREATDIIVHENNDHFNQVTRTQGASEKIINALAGVNWNDKFILFSGGWDKNIKKWVIDGSSIKLEATVDVDIIVNAIAVGDKGEVFAGGSDGHIVRVEVQ